MAHGGEEIEICTRYKKLTYTRIAHILPVSIICRKEGQACIEEDDEKSRPCNRTKAGSRDSSGCFVH